MKIGELAKHAGLTVRTLHHYDSIGLLSPPARSRGGFRAYGKSEIIRLYRIQALKQLGCSLPEIAALLKTPQLSPLQMISQQLSLLDAQSLRINAQRRKLRSLGEEISRGTDAGLSDWLQILELTALYEKHFSAAELRRLRVHRQKAAVDLYAEWPKLISLVQAAIDRKLVPESDEAQALALRWMQLAAQTTGNQPSLARKLRAVQQAEPRIQELNGATAAVIKWIERSQANSKLRKWKAHVDKRKRSAKDSGGDHKLHQRRGRV